MKIIWNVPIPAILLLTSLSSVCSGQPFLNSLAVLFRSRPPWPTTFPSNKFTPIPPPLHSPSSGVSQGILVARPISPSSSTAYESINEGMKSKQPDTIENVQTAHPYPSSAVPGSQQNFVPIQPSPTSPMFPPPIPFFQNSHVVGAVYNGLPTNGGNNHPSNTHGGSNMDSSGLIASPTTIHGSIALPDPPTTVANPHYGVLLENSNGNFQKTTNKKLKFRVNSWSPLPNPDNNISQNNNMNNNNNPNTNSNNNPNNNNNNNQYNNNNNNPSNHYSGQGNINNGNANSANVYQQNVKENSREQKKIKDFRPSPQLNSFLETTVITDYGSHINANGGSNIYGYNGNGPNSKDAQDKPTSNFEPTEAKSHPRYESGFRPISYDQYAANFGSTATRQHYTNSHQQYFNPWSIPFDGNGNNPQQQPNSHSNDKKDENDTHEIDSGKIPKGIRRKEKPFRQDRQMITASLSKSKASAEADVSAHEGSSSEEGDKFVFVGNRGKKKSSEQNASREKKLRHRFPLKGKKNQGMSATISSTTASSELVEEWLPPGISIEKKSDTRKTRPIFSNRPKPIQKVGTLALRGLVKIPDKCEKFNRFGFCPVTKQYPLNAAESIASRCTALMPHLIAPLPKMDVMYDAGPNVKNGTVDGRGRPSGWSWKSFQGKPVCDTDELSILPGWARNEKGDWMIILQTKIWQQKAHITLCSPSATQCHGLTCNKTNSSKLPRGGNRKDDSGLEMHYQKCVQRFTAQRLAVFDPENLDRCPVVHSVFLPSACVCLTSSPSPSGSETRSPEKQRHSPGSDYSQYASRQPLFSPDEEDEAQVSEEDLFESYHDSTEAPPPPAPAPSPSYRRTKSVVTSSHSRKSTRGHPRRSDTFDDTPISNATFMIITEKFSTSESSKEDNDRGEKTSNGTRSTP